MLTAKCKPVQWQGVTLTAWECAKTPGTSNSTSRLEVFTLPSASGHGQNWYFVRVVCDLIASRLFCPSPESEKGTCRSDETTCICI